MSNRLVLRRKLKESRLFLVTIASGDQVRKNIKRAIWKTIYSCDVNLKIYMQKLRFHIKHFISVISYKLTVFENK